MPSALYKDLWDTIRQGKPWRGEIMNRAKDGSAYWVDVNIDPQWGPDGQIVGFTAVRQDITDKKTIEKISTMDRLTQLHNRLKLDDSLAFESARALRYDEPLSIILIDIDRFKSINDAHGHLAGDKVLKAIADLIRSDTRVCDIAGRWGGEEFLIICPSTNSNGAHQVAEKLRCRFEERAIAPAGNITCSVGIATLVPGESTNDLVGRADKALYQAKRRGRNRVELAA
jgi:diguanylate cyclase (GGDEF)-like protein